MGALRFAPYRAEVLSALFLMALLLAAPAARAQDYGVEGDARSELGDGGWSCGSTSMMRTKGVPLPPDHDLHQEPVDQLARGQDDQDPQGPRCQDLLQAVAGVLEHLLRPLRDTSHHPSVSQADTFMAGVSLPLPDGLPRGMKDVTWQGKFESDAKGITVQWKWAVLAYSHFMDDYNALEIAPPIPTSAASWAVRSWRACLPRCAVSSST